MTKKEKKLDSMMSKSIDQVISWQAPEFIEYKKDIWWYVGLVFIGIVLIAIFYFTDNLLAIIMIILAEIVIIMTAKQKPKIRSYKLSKDGLYINNKLYPMKDLKSFFITYVENTPNLHFEMVKKFSPPLNVFLAETDENQILNLIRSHLPENTKIKATASDLFSKWFKF
jgi:hypothetical protein